VPNKISFYAYIYQNSISLSAGTLLQILERLLVNKSAVLTKQGAAKLKR
jgi:hypothetical protein